jgi:hypothetical protein
MFHLVLTPAHGLHAFVRHFTHTVGHAVSGMVNHGFGFAQEVLNRVGNASTYFVNFLIHRFMVSHLALLSLWLMKKTRA